MSSDTSESPPPSGQLVGAGEWVRVHRVELEPSQRSQNLPADTAAVPFESWVNGRLVDATPLGAQADIVTLSGRKVRGRLVERRPGYNHTFGSPPAPLLASVMRARELLAAAETE